MKKAFIIILSFLLTPISFAQETDEKEEKLTLSQKLLMKMIFKDVEKPALSEIFDECDDSLPIIGLTSSKYDDLKMAIFASYETEDYEFTMKDDEQYDPDTFVYGKLNHFSSAEIRYLQGLSKDKTKQFREYILTYDNATFIMIYAAPPAHFLKGIKAANKVAMHVKRK